MIQTLGILMVLQLILVCAIWYWMMSLTKWYQKLVRPLSQLLDDGLSSGFVADTIIFQLIWLCQFHPFTNPLLPPAPRPRRKLLNNSSSFKPLSLHWSFLGFLSVLNSFTGQWTMHFVLFIQAFIKYPLLCQSLCFEILQKLKNN